VHCAFHNGLESYVRQLAGVCQRCAHGLQDIQALAGRVRASEAMSSKAKCISISSM
jgi:hypothetical protein